MFTETEVRFLSREHAAIGLKAFPLVDPATLKSNRDQSLRVIQRVLEQRAKVLGLRFAEFQRETSLPVNDLESKIQASKLF
jgi:hypothetical protein